MRTPRLALILSFSLIACTPMQNSRVVGVGEASSLAADDDANGTSVLTGSTLRVWQDKSIAFQPGAGAAGTYTVAGAPAWASLNASTGTLTGIPRVGADAGTFTITRTSGGVQTKYGPYDLQIVGDFLKEQQWPLTNSGQTGFAFDAGLSGQDIHLGLSVTENVLGTGIRVAISDSGTVVAHPDLIANNLTAENRNYLKTPSSDWLGDPTPSSADPENAHGTAVAGLAAAKGWNGIGGRGVAPEAKFAAFLYVQAQDKLDDENLGEVALNDQFAGNFDVFNYSWGKPQCALTEESSTYFAKLLDGVTNLRAGKGAIYLVAGGNDYVADPTSCYASASSTSYSFGNVNFTAAQTTPYVISVGAVQAVGLSSSYSSPGSALWISAPGGEYGYSARVTGKSALSKPALVTTDYPGCGNGLKSLGRSISTFDAGQTPNGDCRYTSTMNGTSGASPIAAGAVALILQANPSLTWRDVKYILAKTADKVDAMASMPGHPVPSLSLSSHNYELPWVTNDAGFHFHDWYGFGRVNVDAAVALARGYTPNFLGTFTDSGWVSSGSVTISPPDNSATGVTSQINVPATLTTEAVQVRVSITGCISDVGLELTSPKGTVSKLMNINSLLRETSISGHVFLTNAFFAEAGTGAYTLKIVDAKASCVPVLTNWQVKVFGH